MRRGRSRRPHRASPGSARVAHQRTDRESGETALRPAIAPVDALEDAAAEGAHVDRACRARRAGILDEHGPDGTAGRPAAVQMLFPAQAGPTHSDSERIVRTAITQRRLMRGGSGYPHGIEQQSGAFEKTILQSTEFRRSLSRPALGR